MSPFYSPSFSMTNTTHYSFIVLPSIHFGHVIILLYSTLLLSLVQ